MAKYLLETDYDPSLVKLTDVYKYNYVHTKVKFIYNS